MRTISCWSSSVMRRADFARCSLVSESLELPYGLQGFFREAELLILRAIPSIAVKRRFEGWIVSTPKDSWIGPPV
jgi:hypothetical protein